MKKSFFIFFIMVLGALIITGCSKKKNCTCTSGGIYEIVDSVLLARVGFPVPNVVFDTVLTQDCYTLNYQDSAGVYYPENGVIMNAFLTCSEK